MAQPNKKIKQLRISQGLSLRELSIAISTPYTEVSKYETGYKKITRSIASRYATYFRVSIDEIMGDSASLKQYTYRFVIEAPAKPTPAEALLEIMKQFKERYL